VLRRKIRNERVHIVRVIASELVGTVSNLWADLVRKGNCESLVAARGGLSSERVQQVARDAKLDQSVLIFVAMSQEPSIEYESVDSRLNEVFRGEARRGVEGLTVREELCRPVHGPAEATCCMSAQG